MTKSKSDFSLVLTRKQAEHLLDGIAYSLNERLLNFTDAELDTEEQEIIQSHKEIQAKLVAYLVDTNNLAKCGHND